MKTITSHPNSLRQRRESAGFTQIQLVVESGIGLSTINRLENHPLPTRPETARRLAAALECQVEEIFPYMKEEASHARN
jgi:transcriptional regulator with XRE-family HTH domain